jgi:2,4-diketo-3-deoxy-L-fuconate hydrolase
MRLLNVRGRLQLQAADRLIDVQSASAGRFSADPQAVYERWAEFQGWASTGPIGDCRDGVANARPACLDAPVPRPRQVFAIGLNYTDHADESGFAVPTDPIVFTKFVSSFTGPAGDIHLPPGKVDWEIELVVVIGSPASRVSEDQAWRHVAGVTVGQDLSERTSQLRGPAPQFSLSKSFPGFTPMGPAVVTADELPDPDDIAITCEVNGEVVQDGRTGDMIFAVPELIARLSRVVTLLPGDVIFTGTPPGVGMGRRPERYLQPGDSLTSRIEGVGEMQHRLIAEPPSRVTVDPQQPTHAMAG